MEELEKLAPLPWERPEDSSRAQTFQGRRIKRIKWKGREVEAVEGLFAYRHKKGRQLEHSAAAAGFKAAVVGSTKVDAMGIGVIAVDAPINEERAHAASADLRADVEWMEPVLIHHASVRPNDPLFPQQWGLKEVRAEQAWNIWQGDPGPVVLAVLDSGIPIQSGALSHPDLNDPQRFVAGRDVVNKDDDPSDDNGHGTHVTGIAAAVPDNDTGVAGLCWRVTVYVLKIFDSLANGSTETFKDGVLHAVDFARARDAHLVINYSGGGSTSDVLRVAVEYARDNGALVVAAAGNGYGSEIDYPAAYSTSYPHVVAVGAVDRNRKRADFSNRGPEMTLVAPGVGILSTMPDYYVTENSKGHQHKYDLMNGTSMATPFVSALAALVWSQWPSLTAEEVRKKLTASADAIPGDQEDFGSGIINAEKALT